MGGTQNAHREPGQGGTGREPGGIASYIDVTVVQGTLSGFVVLLLAGVGTCVFNRFWQRSLLSDASSAIHAAETLGIKLQPLGFGPELVATGVVDGTRVRVRWRGGVLGARSDARIGARHHRLPLLVSAAALHAVVAGEE